MALLFLLKFSFQATNDFEYYGDFLPRLFAAARHKERIKSSLRSPLSSLYELPCHRSGEEREEKEGKKRNNSKNLQNAGGRKCIGHFSISSLKIFLFFLLIAGFFLAKKLWPELALNNMGDFHTHW